MASWIAAGLDFGNKNIVISVPHNGAIDVILNEASNRLTPTIVSYTDTRRYAGIFAQNNQLQHVSSTICDLKRLVCLKYDDPEREAVSKIVPFPLVPLSDGFTGVRIKTDAESSEGEKVLRPEQCIAYLLKSMMSLTKSTNHSISSLLIAVSPWWTEMHRRSLLDACEIASLDCVALINSTTAAAITYTVNHRQRLPENEQPPVNVVFIDFGDSSMNVAVSKITQKSVGISSFACDEHLGGSHFTDKLLNYIIGKIREKCPQFNPASNERVSLRLRKATEELKKKLSINPVVQFETHSFMPDNEFSFNVTREEFESQITDLIERIEAPVIRALELAKVEKKEELFAIECLGGASRVPLVKNRITEIFGREPTQSLNLDECFAVGSGYMAAILSPALRVQMTVKDVAPHAVNAAWEDEDGAKVCELFPQFSKVPSKCRLPLQIKKSTKVKFYSDSCNIAEATVEIPEVEEQVKVSLRVQMTQSSTIQFIEAIYTENDQQKQAKLSFRPLIGLSSNQIQQFKREEDEMDAKDAVEIKIDEMRNELESLIFEAENGFNRDFPECFNPDKMEDCKTTVEKIHNWFTDNEFERLPLDEYQTRLMKIKELAGPAIQRNKAFKKIFDMENSLKTKASSIIEKLKNFAEKSKNETVCLIRDEFQQFMTKLDTDIDIVKKMNKYDDPDFNVEEIEGIFYGFEQKVREMEEAEKKLEEEGGKKGKWCNIQ